MKTKIYALMAVLVLSACQTTNTGPFEWPGFQSGLQPGPSNSPYKAELPDVTLNASSPDVTPMKAKYGGIWEGWMCRDKVVDVKVVVLDLTNDGATVHYASGAKSFGNFKTKIAARFSRDVLTGTFPNGADLVLGMRPDGHMNVKYDTDRWCTGIMQRTKSLPTS